MTGFGFLSVGSLVVEDGASARIAEIVRQRFVMQKVLLVTDVGLVKLGLVKPVAAALEEKGVSVTIFDQVEADPSEMIVQQAITAAKSCAADVIIGFGGGSSLDVAKLVAVLAQSDQDLADIYGLDKVQARKVPLVQIPTTAGTGSEVTPISIITTANDTKMGVVDRHLLADIAILDATLTTGLPASITAATGIDAMVHAIEAYTSAIKKNPMSDALACGALKLLGDNIVLACKDGSNLTARRAMLTGAMMAGVAFTNAPVGAVHALAYPLGGRFHIPHGLSNALVLPHVLRFNALEAGDMYAELSTVIGLSGNTNETKTAAFIDWLESIADTVGIERQLRQMRIQETDVEGLAADAMRQTRLLVNNPREVTLADARAIYEAAW
ncbi:iron-containing alcohol dehydrogenase [Kordiimonas pumila]|uniref:Iron-containing alcohol dehydrogenase n=1 Tax=Kordiimonas pumila TaxID=2161677 RepID=A0ABV7D1G3_9PROT|nr:iron-containing alcohol dehydrogenase [Kordiimonas pumila]